VQGALCGLYAATTGAFVHVHAPPYSAVEDETPQVNGPDTIWLPLLYCICPPGKNSDPLSQHRTVKGPACATQRRLHKIACARQAHRTGESLSLCLLWQW
jgi:hypothetical protein